MSTNTTRALFKDALYQVLDNKAFRVLVCLVVVLILPTLLVGAKDDSLVVLFGWREYFYEDFFQNFDLPYSSIPEANRIELIQRLQKLLVDGLAGGFGIIFAIAATAFFLPNMIEKGAADTVFSKPVSRLSLMLSRYVAGLIFVGVLAVLLVGGIHFGLLLNSGYSDPGFLWSALTLIYVFAILHAFSILVGVFTRSTVAAILLSLIFFAFNGCVHALWKGKELGNEIVETQLTPAQPSPKTENNETLDRLKTTAFLVLDVLHYTLPKTSDADLIAQKLRRTIENSGVAYYDDESQIRVASPPEGFAPDEAGSDPAVAVARWSLPPRDGRPLASISLARTKYEDGNRGKTIKAHKDELAAAGVVDIDEDREQQIMGRGAQWLAWTQTDGERRVAHRRAYFVFGNYVWRLEVEATPEWLAEADNERMLRRFYAGITQASSEHHNPFERFQRRASWTGPLAYNLTFSILSSLAFTAAMLALGWWRLSRIDF
jgi:ABC-type transport system involved in multi-copper enzyme maturation permease subunit